jgi:hypothetical protein
VDFLSENLLSGQFFSFHRKLRPMKQKTLREDRHGAAENFAAEAARRRRRSSQDRFITVEK